MDNLLIKPKQDDFSIPKIDFNAETGICEIAGESFMENPSEFYKPINDWLDEFLFKNRNNITFNIKVYYANTSSSKIVFEVLMKLKKYMEDGGEASVNWFYDKDDIDLLNEIDDYMFFTDMEINSVAE